VKREPIEDRWKSPLWENNPELLEYTSSLERKLKIAEDILYAIKRTERYFLKDGYYELINSTNEALSAIKEE